MDIELDSWICKIFGLTAREFNTDDLFNIVLYFFPEAEFCKDDKIIVDTGCAYIKLSKNAEDQTILITHPSTSRVSQALYTLVIALAIAYRDHKKEVTIPKYL